MQAVNTHGRHASEPGIGHLAASIASPNGMGLLSGTEHFIRNCSPKLLHQHHTSTISHQVFPIMQGGSLRYTLSASPFGSPLRKADTHGSSPVESIPRSWCNDGLSTSPCWHFEGLPPWALMDSPLDPCLLTVLKGPPRSDGPSLEGLLEHRVCTHGSLWPFAFFFCSFGTSAAPSDDNLFGRHPAHSNTEQGGNIPPRVRSPWPNDTGLEMTRPRPLRSQFMRPLASRGYTGLGSLIYANSMAWPQY